MVGPIYWFHSQRQIACWDITEIHIPSIYLYKRVFFQFTSGRSAVGGTIQKLPELRDSVSCLWTVVSAEEWKCFPLFWVKRTCSVGLPIIVPRAGKLDFQRHFSQKSTLFPLSLYLPVQKKKREKSSCLWWTEVRFLRGNVHKELTSFSRQCHSVMQHVLPST